MGHLPHQPDRSPMCIALREGLHCHREGSCGNEAPNTGTWEKLFPSRFVNALGNHSKVPQLWLWCSLSSADIPVTPFMKKQSKQTKRGLGGRERERRFRTGASTSCFLVKLGAEYMGFFCLFSLYLPLHTYFAAKGTTSGFPTHCSVLHLLLSPQM